MVKKIWLKNTVVQNCLYIGGNKLLLEIKQIKEEKIRKKIFKRKCLMSLSVRLRYTDLKWMEKNILNGLTN